MVDDHALAVGGKQRIMTIDGYVIPLDMHNGLPYIKTQPYTDTEYDELPHVIMCSNNDWDPAVLDKKISDDDEWYDAVENFSEIPDQSNFDERGNFHKRTIPDETFKLTPEI